jgi:hypothetical protein
MRQYDATNWEFLAAPQRSACFRMSLLKILRFRSKGEKSSVLSWMMDELSRVGSGVKE